MGKEFISGLMGGSILGGTMKTKKMVLGFMSGLMAGDFKGSGGKVRETVPAK